MRLNRILTAIAEWLNALVWWREGKVSRRPYELITAHHVPGAGLLLSVRRNPEHCPRDVGTAIWMPIRTGACTAPDCHVLIDHLDGMANQGNRHTHQITIALASHWPDADGLYSYDVLFVATADLQGLQPRRDLNVKKILYGLAQPLTLRPSQQIDWAREAISAMATCGLVVGDPNFKILSGKSPHPEAK